jgi:hypothetical protein
MEPKGIGLENVLRQRQTPVPKIEFDRSTARAHSLFPDRHGAIDAFTIDSFSLGIYLRPDHWRCREQRRCAGAPTRHRKTLTHMVSAALEIVAGKRVAPEAMRRIGVEPDRHAAVAARVARTRRQNSVTADFSSQCGGEGAKGHFCSSDSVAARRSSQ